MIIREATRNDVSAIAKVHVDTWRTTYRGIVPDRQFYAALGSNPIHEKELEIGGKSLIEVAYGWIDTKSLRGG